MNPTVRIRSFGYHRSGPPSDEAGHGGGFVFDCRLLPNPGKEDRFKQSTGLDADLRDWLDARPETSAFLEAVDRLIDQAVTRYSVNWLK